MKKIFTLIVGIVLSITILNSQVAPPQAFRLTATIAGASGQTVVDKIISLRVSILQDDMYGYTIYSESFSPTTDHYSQVAVEIGRGKVISGIFSSIDWSAHKYFLKIEVDAKGGTNYQLLSSTQLLSVPYALYAGNVGNSFSGRYNDLIGAPVLALVATTGQYNDLSGKPPLFSGSYNDLNNKPTFFSGSYNDLSNKPTLFDGTWGSLTGKPTFSAIALSGSWKDLINTPTTLTGFGITDAMSTSHPANGISATNISNWNTAFSWGNHAGLYKPISYVPSWIEITGKPTGNNKGDMQYWNGTNWEMVNVGSDGQVLTLVNGVPLWGSGSISSQLPTLTTLSISSINTTEATSGGNITSDGGKPIISRGVCWGTTQNPTIINSKTADGIGSGSFTSNLTGLNPGTSYYVRAYATNDVGTSYGNQISFTTASADDIYVIGSSGMDVSGCGTNQNPCKSITYGISRAKESNHNKVLVNSGNYNEQIVIVDGISIFGGYTIDQNGLWQQSSKSNLAGEDNSSLHKASIIANSITHETTINGFDIQAPINDNPSGNSYAIYISNSNNNLKIEQNIIHGTIAGNGDDGNSGNNGQIGNPGSTGVNSMESTTCINNSGGSGGHISFGSITPIGGNGGAVICPIIFKSPAGSGSSGSSAGTVLGGINGFGGFNRSMETYGTCLTGGLTGSGTNGGDGHYGIDGIGGTAGNNPLGSILSLHWVGEKGSDGQSGTPGSGGGGGGAGGCLINISGTGSQFDIGPTGGGGGSGAEGGDGGQGGNPGGSSFCIFIINSVSPNILNNQFYLGRGGNGGNGGFGGNKGLGGLGGKGGIITSSDFAAYCIGSAGNGGNGGGGGFGGGGGGGTGGNAFGIYTSNVSGSLNFETTGNTFIGGNAGTGGKGGQSYANSGQNGSNGIISNCSYK